MGQDSRVAVRLLSCSVRFAGIIVLFLSAGTWLPASAQGDPHDPSVVRAMVGHAEQVMRGDSNQMKKESSCCAHQSTQRKTLYIYTREL